MCSLGYPNPNRWPCAPRGADNWHSTVRSRVRFVVAVIDRIL